MFGNKKITTLAEDFKSLGLIKENNSNAKSLSENKDEKRKELIDKQRREKIAEARKRKIAEQKKAQLRKLAEQNKRKELLKRKKLAENRKRVANRKRMASAPKKTGVKNTLENLMQIESKLNTSAPLADIIAALQNVTKISELAAGRFKKVSEDLTMQGRDGSDVAPAQQSQGKEIGKDGPEGYQDMLDGQDHEGDVGHDASDEQEGGAEPGMVDTVTGKMAGKPAHKDAQASEKNLMGEMDEFGDDEGDDLMGEMEGEDDDLSMEMDDMSDDEMKLDDEEPLGMEMDDELDGEGDIDLMVDEPAPEDDMDMDMDLELGDEEMSDEPMDDMDMELDLGDEDEGAMADSDEDELVMNGEDEEDDEEMVDFGMESKSAKASAYIAELNTIQKESEDILKKINKHALSPQDAEGLLKDVVMRLGGAVGDLHAMEKFAASGEQKSMGESRRKKKVN